MLIYKCDSCKKSVKDKSGAVTVTLDYFQSCLLCKVCGKSILGVLKKKGLKISKVK